MRVHVVTHKPADLPGASVERFTVPKPSIGNLRRWRERWRRYLQSFARRFDIVHVHFLADWGFTRELLAEGCFVATPWGSDVVPPPGEGDATESLVESRVSLLRHAALVTAWGPSFARSVADFAGIDETAVELLPLGVDLNLFRPCRDSHFARHGYFQVGYCKGFREVYGAAYLVRAMPFIVEAHPTVRFLMKGLRSPVRWPTSPGSMRRPLNCCRLVSISTCFGHAAILILHDTATSRWGIAKASVRYTARPISCERCPSSWKPIRRFVS